MAAPVHRASGLATSGTTTTSVTINKPAGTATGDVLYAVVSNGGTNVAPTGAQSGWTLVTGLAVSTTFWAGVYQHIVTDGSLEPASYTWSGFVDSCTGCMEAVSGADTTSPTHQSQATATVNGNIACTSITTTVPDCLILALAGIDDNTSVTDATWACATNPTALTERAEQLSSGGADTGSAIATAPQTATGPTGALTATLAGTRDNVGFLIAVQPPQAGAPSRAPQIVSPYTGMY